MNHKEPIREFVISNFLYGDAAALNDHMSFIESGIVDSTGILELIAFLEEKFQIQVLESEMVPDNLDSVERLVRFVGGKLAGAARIEAQN